MIGFSFFSLYQVGAQILYIYLHSGARACELPL